MPSISSYIFSKIYPCESNNAFYPISLRPFLVKYEWNSAFNPLSLKLSPVYIFSKSIKQGLIFWYSLKHFPVKIFACESNNVLFYTKFLRKKFSVNQKMPFIRLIPKPSPTSIYLFYFMKQTMLFNLIPFKSSHCSPHEFNLCFLPQHS